MSYFDRELITDTHVRDISDRESIDGQLAALDDEIRIVCIARGVSVSEIPVDENGKVTSSALKRYAAFWLYFTILHDYWGSSGMDTGVVDDIYKQKLAYYETKMNQAKNDLTAENIIGEPLDQASFIKQVPVF